MDREAERLHRAVGQRLRGLREQQSGLSQERLAERAGFHRTFVGKLERGETAATVDSLAALCSALGTTLADFFRPFDRSFDLRGPRRRRG
jgi:transcriptional regulator with XRE-family HTH domain